MGCLEPHADCDDEELQDLCQQEGIRYGLW
jgi:hypothetical protein